jgi:hypothetical protein
MMTDLHDVILRDASPALTDHSPVRSRAPGPVGWGWREAAGAGNIAG